MILSGIRNLGYLPLTHHEASFFFRLIVPRYERGSLNVTNDKSFLDWREDLNDHVLAPGIIDRSLHHATRSASWGELLAQGEAQGWAAGTCQARR